MIWMTIEPIINHTMQKGAHCAPLRFGIPITPRVVGRERHNIASLTSFAAAIA